MSHVVLPDEEVKMTRLPFSLSEQEMLKFMARLERFGVRRSDVQQFMHDDQDAFRRVSGFKCSPEEREEIRRRRINCDRDLFVPPGWRVLPEDQLPLRKTGFFVLDPKNMAIVPPERKMTGHELRDGLRGVMVMNATVLDAMLIRDENVPRNWRAKYLDFWGTVYRDENDVLYVRSLYSSEGQTYWTSRSLDEDFGMTRWIMVYRTEGKP